jgi:hypothetical protein
MYVFGTCNASYGVGGGESPGKKNVRIPMPVYAVHGTNDPFEHKTERRI